MLAPAATYLQLLQRRERRRRLAAQLWVAREIEQLELSPHPRSAAVTAAVRLHSRAASSTACGDIGGRSRPVLATSALLGRERKPG